MKFTLLPTAIRNFFVRHQAAATSAVFFALVLAWGVMLWTTPEREVQAAPFHATTSFILPDPADGNMFAQVTTPSDSLRKENKRAQLSAPADTMRKIGSRDSLGSDSLRSDSLHAVTLTKADSVRIDSMKRVPRDSTARLAQFLYKRPASITALPVMPRGYSMFLKQPFLVQTEVQLDSTGRYVIVRETVGGKDVKIPVRMPLDEYINQRFKAGITKNYEELVLKNEDVKKRDDLGELLTSFTNIDIPIPANPVFSIFGPPRINLHISGAVDIRAAFRNTTTDQITVSALGNSRNEPDFAQEVQINVSGTIGDKLNIVADWNTQRQFEYENQLKIKYTGYEDEIVQSVEAGNVSLPTNSKFISSSSALFGIKAVFQLGPLKLTAIASQKKGQVQEKTVTGGSSEVPFQKKAYDYSKDHFFVDTVYRKFYEPYLQNPGRPVNHDTQIMEYEVWITNQSIDQTYARKGIAYMDLPAKSGSPRDYDAWRVDSATVQGQVENGAWIKLDEGKDYSLSKFTGELTLNRSTEGLAVAIAYRIQGEGDGPADDKYYGTLTNLEKGPDSVLVFKLVKPKTLLPQFKEAWQLMMKNIYPLGGRKIQKAGFSLDIVYRGNTGEPTPKIENTNIIELFGLDSYSDDGNPTPDGRFDYSPGITIDEERGEIIFPSLEPFRQGLIDAFKRKNITASPDDYTYPQVYDTTTFAAQNNSLKDRFMITGKTTAGSSNTINLGFNIVENSVQVMLNGQALVPNVDYTVDYIIGQVIIKNQAALVPGSNLSVKFEQNDLFQLASKTLLGLRGDINFSERTQFGFTAMSLDQQTLSDKVRLGEEPMKNSIYGFDGKTGANLDFLTKAIDALPFISTKEKSDISVFGEAAYMNPDPNTKKSPIPLDEGKSMAYIDDFEGAKRTIPLGVGYGLWHDMSSPAYQENVDSSRSGGVDSKTRSYSKARTYWYNILPSDVSVSDLYGDKKTVATGQDQLTVLNLNFNPRQRGEYNYSPHLSQNFGPNVPSGVLKKNWGGVQRVLSSSALDLVRENVNFIELWVKVDSGRVDTTRKIFIDLGAISEDVIPNGTKDTEDQGFPNGTLNEGEDTGIDAETDDQERSNHPDFLNSENLAAFPELSGDPAGDNWVAPVYLKDYKGGNGTEKNAASEIGKFPDTEDLNHNNALDRTDSYFEYELKLDTSAANPQRVGGGLKGWYQYRIPLINYKTKVGSPDFSVVEYARIWMTNFDEPVDIRIYDMNLVGNQWEELKKNDSTFVVSTINVEDNQNYVSPPGVIREQDKSVTDRVVYGNEQSLLLKVSDMRVGDSRQAIKRFTYKTLDVFNYSEMKMFVHGSPSFHAAPLPPSAKLFVRFGRDSLNYYVYRAPIRPGLELPKPSAADAPSVWPSENNVDIIFAELTKLKQGRDSLGMTRPVWGIAKGGPPGAEYGVYGNPDLTRIAFISVGVENSDSSSSSERFLTGDVWINELRLVGANDTPGWAYSVSAALKLADLATVGFTYAKQDPYFHQLETAFGSRTTSVNWNLTASISLERFLPTSWAGTSFPLTYSHSEGISTPLYLPGSDVFVTKAAEQQRDSSYAHTLSRDTSQYEYEKLIFESQTIRISDSYSLPTFKLNIPSDSWYIQDIINKMQFGFTYNTSFDRAPQKEFGKAWNWQATFGYAYTFSPDLYFMPFDIFDGVPVMNGLKDLKVFFPITNFSLKLASSRSQLREKIRNQNYENPIQRSFSASRGFSFGWKLTENGFLNLSGDYSVDIASTLVHLETNEHGGQRGFISILSSLFMRDQLLSFGIDNSYMQNLNINSRPRVPDLFSINKYLTLNARYGVGYSWSNNLQLGDLGKSTRWSNNISVGSDLSLKQFVESWWPTPKSASQGPGEPIQNAAPSPRRRNRDGDEADNEARKTPDAQTDRPATADSTGVKADTLKTGFNLSEKLLSAARIVIKTPLLDFEKINMTFSQTNSSTNTGVPGRPGFANFFGRIPLIDKGVPNYGPTWAYQMGFVSDPTANITDFHFQSKFPFFGFATDSTAGLAKRAAFLPVGSTLPEAFNQSNKLTFKTNRDLWEGARIDLNWSVGWDFAQSQNIRIDRSPIINNDTTHITNIATISSQVTGGAIERSFFSLPMLPFLKSNIDEVTKRFKEMADDPRPDDQKLSEAFEKGFESLPFLRKLFGQYMPRMNYALRWDGLEKYSMFTTWATRVSLDHAYQSTYRRTFKGNPSGVEVTESQRVTYGFAPLLGLSITFKELLKGNMSANLRFSKTESYDLMPSAKNIAQSGSNEISVTASYGRSGFEIPFFGLALNNDVDISFNYSYAKSSRSTYPFGSETYTPGGTPGEGSSRTTMEPRIKYVLSARVTASLFYRYTKVTPDAGGSRIPGSSTNEGGVDVHIAIQ